MEKFAEIGMLLGIYGGLLTERQRDVMDLYYNYDLSLSEIGEQLNISRQGVHDIVKRAEQILLNTEESVDVLGFGQRLMEETDDIVMELDRIIQMPHGKFAGNVPGIKEELEAIRERVLKLRDI